MKYIEITDKEAMDSVRFGGTCFIKRADGTIEKVIIEHDDWAETPREWDNLGTIISAYGDWDIADEGWSFPKDEAREKVEEMQTDKNIYIVPIYMYDHSSQSISLKPFGDRWDSGVCGYMFVRKDKVFNCFGSEATEENWKQLAQTAFESEIEVYNYYIEGEVYQFGVFQEHIIEHHDLTTDVRWTSSSWEETDSCSGFYGSDCKHNGMLDYIAQNADDVFVKQVED